MKKTIFITFTFFMLTGWFCIITAQGQNNHQTILTTKANMRQNHNKLRHVVLFEFKEGTSDRDITKVEKAFSALPGKIPQIQAYEWGTNNSPERLNEGLTHCFLVSFNSEEDRAVYLPHPAHKAFVEVLKPHLKRAVVVDYWANE